jgi:hypothetical protein
MWKMEIIVNGGWMVDRARVIRGNVWLNLAKIEFKAVAPVIVAERVETFAEWIETALVLPLVEIVPAMTSLWVQWIFAGIIPALMSF